jgi:hypothetical protein
MQFKDAAAAPLPADSGYGPFLCARRMAGRWRLYAANPLRGYGRE